MKAEMTVRRVIGKGAKKKKSETSLIVTTRLKSRYGRFRQRDDIAYCLAGRGSERMQIAKTEQTRHPKDDL